MANLIQDYLLYYAIALLTLAVAWFVGKALLALMVRRSTWPDLSALVVGLTILTLVNSFGYQHPAAPWLAILIMGAGALWMRLSGQNRGEVVSYFSPPQTKPWKLLLGYTAIFTVVFLRYFSVEYYPWFNAERDHVFYGVVAEFMNNHAAENPYLDRAGTDGLGMIPYHYAEIHLTGLVSRVTGILPVFIYHFVIGPVLLFTLWVAILQCWRSVNAIVRGNAWFVALALVLCSSHAILNPGPTWVNHIKFIPAILCGVFMLKGVLDRNWRLLLLAQMTLCIWNHGFAVLMLMAIPAELIAFRIFGWVRFSGKEWLQYGAAWLGFAVLYQLWVTGFMDAGGSPTNPALGTLMSFYEGEGSYTLAIKNGLTYVLQSFTYFPVFFVIAIGGLWYFWRRKPSVNPFLLMLLGLLIVAAAITTLFYFFVDVWQVFLGVWMIMLPVLLIYVIGNIIESRRKWLVMSTSAFLIFLAAYSNTDASNLNGEALKGRFGRYSLSYLQEMKANAHRLSGPGIRLLGPEAFQSEYEINSLLHFEGFPLYFVKPGVELHTPQVWNIPRRESNSDIYNFNRDIIIKNSFVYQYYQTHGWDEAQGADQQLFEQFVKDEQVGWFIAAPDQPIPDFLAVRVVDTITDPRSGERLCILQ